MKMPTTSCNNVESKPSTDAGDAAKQCLNSLEKKVRNLEKRKGRIEQNQEKAKKGVKLEKEQEDSLQQYDQVMHNLEFARDLYKQFLQINHEQEKMTRKQAKKEKAERQLMEIKRMNEILQLQAVLDLLAAEKVREDFKAGNQGAVVLTEDNLNQLDELYLAICPSRGDSGDDYLQNLTLAAEHIVSYLDGKDKKVAGTTYRDLKVLITLIIECGYFKKEDQQTEIVGSTAELSQETVAATEEPVTVQAVSAPEKEETHDTLQQPSVDQTGGALNAAQSQVELAAQHQRDLAAQHQRDLAAQHQRDLAAQHQRDLAAQHQRDLAAKALSTLEQDSLFAPSSLPYQSDTASHFPQASHTATSHITSHTAASHIPTYPSFTNGPFQFIQASYVMPESVSPGLMDPAIIVAQPAGNSGRQFISQRYDNQPHIAAQMQQLQTQQQQQQQQQPKQMVNSMIDPQSNTNQQSRKPQQILQDYNSQTYAQDQSSQQLQREKKFQMNVSAPVFQSMYSQVHPSEVAVGPAAPSAVPQASVPLAGETQLPTSAADVSNKSVASRDFGQSGAGDYQEMAAFQGHPPGNSYRPDSYQATYNNYNKSGFSGGPYQKRGGMNSVGGPESGVDPSGGTVGNTSRGGMRGGGITRGGSSDSRGASRGGFTRPLTT